jgi:hypothetical protein
MNGFQKPGGGNTRNFSGKLRNVEAYAHVALGAKIVNFIRRNFPDYPMKRAGVVQIAVMKMNFIFLPVFIWEQMLYALAIKSAHSSNHAVHFISLSQQQFRKIRSILPGYPRN